MDKKAILLVWLILCHFGNVSDIALTLYAIKNGATELNPLMAYALEVSPLFFIIVKFVVFGLAVDFLAKHAPRVLPWIATLYMTVLAWHLNLLYEL